MGKSEEPATTPSIAASLWMRDARPTITYKTYYYIADDDSIEVGDFVVVPAGKDNHEAIVEVVEKQYFSKSEVTLPLKKNKTYNP